MIEIIVFNYYEKIFVCNSCQAGSKGIKNKNVSLLNNKPLIQYTIDTAKN